MNEQQKQELLRLWNLFAGEPTISPEGQRYIDEAIAYSRRWNDWLTEKWYEDPSDWRKSFRGEGCE